MQFDPYYKWLGIPPEQQPADNYRLLGLKRYEADDEVIASAADRQMAHVKSFASGPYAPYSQLLLNELSKARVCLLNAQLKNIYDQQLARQSDQLVENRTEPPQEPFVEAPQDVSQQLEETIPQFQLRSSTTQTKRRTRRLLPALLLNLLILLIGGGLAGGLLYYLAQTAPPQTGSVEKEAHQSKPELAQTEKLREKQPFEPVDRQTSTPGETKRSSRPVAPIPPPTAKRQSNGALPNRSPPDTGTPSRQFRFPQKSDLPVRDNPFDGFASSVNLSQPIGKAQVLHRFNTDSLREDISIELVPADYLAGINHYLFLIRSDEPAGASRWLLFDEGEAVWRDFKNGNAPNQGKAIAEVSLIDNQLTFTWLASASTDSRRDNLRLSLLEFYASGTQHKLQLSQPVVDEEPIVVDDWDRMHEEIIDLEAWPQVPPIAQLRGRLTTSSSFPTTRHKTGDPDDLQQEEQLLMPFTRGAAGLAAYWKARRKQIEFSVAPCFDLRSAPDQINVLSKSSVIQAETALNKRLGSTEREGRKRVAQRAKLSANLTAAQNASYRLPGGGTTEQLQHMRRLRISEAQAKVNQNQARIDFLEKRRKAILYDLESSIPLFKALAIDLQSCQIGFELYLNAGKYEIVCYEKSIATTAKKRLFR